MPKCTMRAFCLLAALAACVLLAQAAPNRRQQQAYAAGYGRRNEAEEYRGKEHHYAHYDRPRDGPGYEQEEPPYEQYQQEPLMYEQHEEHHSYSEDYERRGDGPGYYHKEEHYDKVDVKTFVLQETSRTIPDFITYKSHFRCSKEGDEPDFCLHPSYPDRHYESHDPSNFIEDVLINDRTAECIWEYTSEGCPALAGPECEVYLMNCTIAPTAGECGCPYKSGLFFSTKGYVTPVAASSCQEDYDPAPQDAGRRRLASADLVVDSNNATIYNVTAYVFRGAITTITTREGVQEVKGSVEFVAWLDPAGKKRTHARSPRNRQPQPAPKVQKPSANPPAAAKQPSPAPAPAAKKQDTPVAAAATNYGEPHPDYYEEPHYEQEGPDHGYYPDGGQHKVLVKGGSLKVTIVESMHY